MSRQLFLGLISEGSTDNRFLISVIERTVHEIIMSYGDSVTIEIAILKKESGKPFIEQVIEANKTYHKENFINLLLIHVDADDSNDLHVCKTKIDPLLEKISQESDDLCKDLVPIIPVYMTESWMLADFELFRDEISTEKSKTELGLNKKPEDYNDPKLSIELALRVINDVKPKKRRHDLKIKDLYQIIGQKVELDKLKILPSYMKFYREILIKLAELNFINIHSSINKL
ncbi:DUF4276 family protein [Elizabethkingia bruuniana]|uniref:DUF4276 family protein n=1 Tax=Elizabethkingia bruuniana TaxID=1756149 RepID=UPI0024202900|nr:DUF4276 family protein [Elizabethkingia bruuniana]